MPPLPTGGLVEVDCAHGPVNLWEAPGQYVLRGSCSSVRVSGAYIKVYFEYADKLEITSDTVTARADRVGRLVVDGTQADVRITRGVNTLLMKRAVNRVRIGGTCQFARVTGSSQVLRSNRLREVVVGGQRNLVVVKYGRTKVINRGHDNIIRARR